MALYENPFYFARFDYIIKAMMNFIYNYSQFLPHIPKIFSYAIFVLLFFSLFKKEAIFVKIISIKRLIVLQLSFFTIYSFFLTYLQYFTWKNNEFSKTFLPPHQSIAYFIKYSFTHFWLGMLLGIVVAFLFYFILKTVGKYFKESGNVTNPEASPSSEKIGLLGALIVSWPDFIIFVVVALLSAVIFSVYRGVIYKKTDISLFWPFIFASAVTLIFGDYLIIFFRLAVLRI